MTRVIEWIVISQCLTLVILFVVAWSIHRRITKRQKKNKQIIQNLITKLKNSGKLSEKEIKEIYAEVDAISGRLSRSEFRSMCEIDQLIEEKSSVQE